MTTWFAEGSATTELSNDDLRAALFSVYDQLAPRRKVIALPPDFTRLNSRAGPLTCHTFEYFGDALTDVMPTLGTHTPMTTAQIDRMYPGLPHSLIREHRWREDVVTVGEVPADFVRNVTDGVWERPWPAQMNRLIWKGGHDLIVSIGQVVPHEVIGMANYNKNLFVGAGGAAGINESHFIGAAYGMERMMGRANTPLRLILNQAQDQFCGHMPLLYVLTVVGSNAAGELVTRGLYVGDDHTTFERAARLAAEVNFTQLDEPLDNVVVWLDPEEFHTTWLGNKSIYRTRMAMADGGRLTVLAPGVGGFGEDATIDALIRRYGYRTTPEIMASMQANQDLQDNLSAAAHLIHGSSEGRFEVVYCPGGLSQAEVEGVGYRYGDLNQATSHYGAPALRDGWNHTADGERFYYIGNPALGLWAARARMSG